MRIAAGYPSGALAAHALGVTRVYYLDVERGNSRPSEKLRKRMASRFKVEQAIIDHALALVQRELLERQLEQVDLLRQA
jgi:transcriptional regulator with XRE-family HTH domain